MTADILLTIVVPVHNAETHVKSCLDSLRRQSLRQMEVVVIDDASTDRSGEVVSDYLADHPDFAATLLRLPCNRGVSYARNAGVAISRGDYVGFVDADDTVDCRMYEELSRAIRATASSFAACAGAVIVDQRETGRLASTRRSGVHSGRTVFFDMCRGKFPSSVCFMIFDIGIFDTVQFIEDRRFEDFIFLAQALPKADRVLILEQAMYHYHRRPGTETGTLGPSVLDLLVGRDVAVRTTKSVSSCWAERRPLEAHLYLRASRTIAHQVFGFGGSDALEQDFLAPALDDIRWRDIVLCLIVGDFVIAASSAVLRVFPSLYGWLFGIRREWRFARSMRAVDGQ